MKTPSPAETEKIFNHYAGTDKLMDLKEFDGFFQEIKDQAASAGTPYKADWMNKVVMPKVEGFFGKHGKDGKINLAIAKVGMPKVFGLINMQDKGCKAGVTKRDVAGEAIKKWAA